LGLNQSGRTINLRFLSLQNHLEVITDARALCDAVYAQLPDDPGMGLLAAQFTNTDRVEYLDKS
jgi:ATP-dependent DNA helicase RecG